MAITFTEQSDDIFATTLRHIRPNVVDNFFDGRPFFVRLYNNKRIMLSGGREVQQNILVDVPPGGSYGRGDEFDISKKDLLAALRFPWAMYYSAVTADGLDEIQNGGAEQIMDLAKIRLEAARDRIENDIGTDLFGDGTGNFGKVITGLKAAIDDGTNVAAYGGLTRATTGAGSKINGNLDPTGGTLTLNAITALTLNASRGPARPDLLITTRSLWGKIHDRIQPSQRQPATPQGQQVANAGFEVLRYMGMDCVYDDGVPAGELYVLNTNTFALYLHTVRNFIIRGPFTPANADQKTWQLLTAVQLVCSSPRLNGRMTGLS